MKKVLSLFICLLMVVTTLTPLTSFTASAATSQSDDVFTILAASDFQTKGASLASGGSYDVYEASEEGAGIVKNLMASVTAAHPKIDAFLFGGDYSHGSSNEVATFVGQEYLYNALVEGGLSEKAKQFYLTGNHENGQQKNEKLPFFAQTGGYDMGQYAVYCINHDGYPYNQSNKTVLKNLTTTTAQNLGAWLDEQEVGQKPIFVMSHLPLHYSTRTRTRNDGLYAEWIVNELNRAGKRGLNIIFLYGHNHAGGYDTYMGGSTNFATAGDSIWVAKPGVATAGPNQHTLHFTYMNYGYLGYYEPTWADNDFTMTVFEVLGDDVTIRRYDQNGEHDLQAKEGKFWISSVHNDSQYGYQPDTKTQSSGFTVYGGNYTLTLQGESGSVPVGTKIPATTGSKIIKTFDDGNQITIDVTAEMLYRNDRRLTETDLAQIAVLSGLTLKYQDTVLTENYELKVQTDQEYLFGDVNNDKTVNAVDALIALQGALGQIQLDDTQKVVANVDGIPILDASDSLMILQFAVGKIQKFPVES
jgi:hypothetical protein